MSTAPDRTQTLDRRGFLLRGSALGAAALLPGCGGGDETTTAPATAATGPTGPAKTPRPSIGKSISDLTDAIRGQVVTPGSGGFTTAAEVYNQQYDGAKPVAVVVARDAADVQTAVRWAGAREVSVVPRSGGHSYAGYSTGDGVLVVDLRKLSAVHLDKGSGTATIGPGAQLIDVYSALSRHGATVPAGSCPSVCLGGLAPGGGHGLAGRKFGLTCDNIESLEVVTADGELREAGTKHEPDLFWAFRGGGGGNFGVATSFEMKAHTVDSAAWFNIDWPWSSASDALAAWQELLPDAPPELTAIFHLSTGEGSPSASSDGQFFGSEDQLKSVLAPLSAVDGAQLSTGADTYLNLMLRWAGCLGRPFASCHTQGAAPGGTMERDRFIAKSDYATRAFPGTARAKLVNALESAQNDSSISSAAILFDSYGGAINDVAPDATAFVHRQALFAMQYLVYIPQGGTQAGEDWLDSAWKPMRKFVSGQAYQDYIDPKLEGWEEAYYGANYQRLQQVKASYDPDFRFKFAQAIQPA